MLRIDCPHCGKPFKKWPDSQHSLGTDAKGFWIISGYACPFCEKYTITHQCVELEDVEWIKRESSTFIVSSSGKTLYDAIAYPKQVSRRISAEVPEKLKAAFAEADSVVSLSPTSSVALSRKILQLIFHHYLRIERRDLGEEIDAFIAERHPPAYLVNVLGILNRFGNKPVGQEIMGVDQSEAEYTLAVVESMFDFIFVQPARAKAMTDQWLAKNKELGEL